MGADGFGDVSGHHPLEDHERDDSPGDPPPYESVVMGAAGGGFPADEIATAPPADQGSWPPPSSASAGPPTNAWSATGSAPDPDAVWTNDHHLHKQQQQQQYAKQQGASYQQAGPYQQAPQPGHLQPPYAGATPGAGAGAGVGGAYGASAPPLAGAYGASAPPLAGAYGASAPPLADAYGSSPAPPASGAYGAAPSPPPAPARSARQAASPGPGAARIAVEEPLKQGEGVSAHVSYRVATQWPGRPRVEVIRRFRDWVWLNDSLRESHRGVIVPALPPRNAMEKYKMSPEFIATRRAALEVYLNRLADHPALHDAEELELFLTAPEDGFAAEVARREAARGGGLGALSHAPALRDSPAARAVVGGAASLLAKIGRQAQALAARAQAGRVGDAAALGPPGSADDPSGDEAAFARARIYVAGLEPLANDVQRACARAAKAHRQRGAALREFGVSLRDLRTSREAAAGADLEAAAAAAAQAAEGAEAAAQALERQAEVPLRELARLVRSAKRTLDDRAAAAAAARSARADRDARRARLAKLRATPGIRPERVADAEADVAEASRKAQLLADEAKAISERLRPELARFQKERADRLGEALRAFAGVEAKAAADAQKVWERMFQTNA